MRLCGNALNITTSGIRKMFDLASDYDNVINLCIGEPGFTTPENIKDAAKEALDKDYTKYTSNIGMIELREALARKLKRDNNIEANPQDEIIVTTGAGEALAISLMSFVNPGDEVIVPNPYWPNYLGQITMLGGVPVLVDTFEEEGFTIKADAIKEKITDKTKVIMINSPSNPTGGIIPEEEQRKIGKLAKEYDLMIISDEPYEKLVYDEYEHFSLGSVEEFKDYVITINSLSKTYAMTGWRVGYAQGPKEAIASMVRFQQNISSCVNSIAQYASIEAINGPQDRVGEMVEEYAQRRDLLVNGLNQLKGVTCKMPKGAFYAFANIKDLNLSSQEVAETLIRETQVITTPGSAFGSAGEGYIRFSFASNKEEIIEAIDRMKNCSLFKE